MWASDGGTDDGRGMFPQMSEHRDASSGAAFYCREEFADSDQRARGGAHLLKAVTEVRRLLTAHHHRRCERCKRDQSAGAWGFRDFSCSPSVKENRRQPTDSADRFLPCFSGSIEIQSVEADQTGLTLFWGDALRYLDGALASSAWGGMRTPWLAR